MKPKKRRCQCCGRYFLINPRVPRQRYCSNPECQDERQASNRADWLKRPENRDYFHGPENAERVRSWRKTQIDQEKVSSAASNHTKRVQEEIMLENAVRQTLNKTLTGGSVQEVIIPENILLLGFIAEITGHTEQELMAKTFVRIYGRGRRVLSRWLAMVAQQGSALHPDDP